MSREPENHSHPDRRDFLKTAGAAAAGALLLPRLEAVASTPGIAESASAARAGWTVRPFALTQVKLAESLFTQKRDRMLAYARGYGGDADVFAGPDRVLSIFRANAGLDTKGAQPVGSWENGTGYLRGHYAGHFMSMLAQAYAAPATRSTSRSSTTSCAAWPSVRTRSRRRRASPRPATPANSAARCDSAARPSDLPSTSRFPRAW